MIVIVDLHMGNIDSVARSFKKMGEDVVITETGEELESATHIILPGVGNFRKASEALEATGIGEMIKHEVLINKKPLLGICLGMQLLFSKGMEGGVESPGLDLIKGKVDKIRNSKSYRLPHMGWNNLISVPDSPILKGVSEESTFYFVHSYEAIPQEDVKCSYTDYGDEVLAAVQKENIFGTQFHPEKSQADGFEILKNFAGLSKC